MFLMPVGGGGGGDPAPTPKPNPPPVPKQTQQFVSQMTQSSLSSAQSASTAYEAAVTNGDSQSTINQKYQDMINKWGTYEYWLEDQLRIARLSGGKTAVNGRVAGIRAGFSGDSYTKGIFNQVVKLAQGQVLGESKPHSVTEIAIATSQADQQNIVTAQQVQATDAKLPAGIRDADPEIETEANQGVTQAEQAYLDSLNAIHDDLIKELGLSGNFTDQQLTAALQKLQASYQGQGLDSLISMIGAELKVNRNLNNITTNASSLSPIAKKLAQTDPVSLAFIEAAGVSLNPKDYSTNPKAANYLSPQEFQLMSSDPMAFAMMRLAGVSILPASNGQGVQVYINGKLAQNLSAEQVKAAQDGDVDPLVTSLVAQTQWSPTIQTLMAGTDMVRLDYATGKMQKLMSGPDPNIPEALQFLTTNLNGMFSQDTRADLWQQAGLPYFSQQWVATQINQIIKGNPLSSGANSGYNNADKVGMWMQQILANAPPELANIILNTVESKFSGSWYQSNQMSSGMPPFQQFYKGLSMAVELVPSRAQEVANWLLDRSAPQWGILYEMNDSSPGFGFDGVKTTMVEGYPTLSVALDTAIQSDHSVPESLSYQFNLMAQQGAQTLVNNYLNNINRQQYLNFINNPGQVLNPYFNSFPKYLKMGTAQKITSDTQLRDLVGTALGLTPTNQTAAKAGDFSKEWYTPGTADWSIIQVALSWIHQVGGNDPTVTFNPYAYADQTAGVQFGALFSVTTSNGSQEIIDGMAAEDAVQESGGAPVNANDVGIQWKYSSVQNFEDNNQLDPGGYIYLPKNLQTSAGSIVLTADITSDNSNAPVAWSRYAAHIVTPAQRIEQIGSYVAAGLAAVGAGLMIFVSGGLATPLVAAGFGMFVAGSVGGIALSGLNLAEMDRHGASLNPFVNSEAQADWLNIAGNTLALATVGTGAWYSALTRDGAAALSQADDAGLTVAERTTLTNEGRALLARASLVNKFSRVTGFLTTGIGFRQSVSQLANIVDGNLSGWQLAASVGLMGMGLAQMGIGARSWTPADPPEIFENLVSARANELLAEAQLNGTAAPGATAADYMTQASADIWRPVLDAKAFQLHLDNSARTPDENYSLATEQVEMAVGMRARDLWRAAGRPTGTDLYPDDPAGRTYDQVFWRQAENQVYRQGGDPIIIRTTVAGKQEYLEQSASALWEDGGRQDGQQLATWLQAEKELQSLTTLRATGLWRVAGRPMDGSAASANWDTAESEIFGPPRTAPQVNWFMRGVNRLSDGWTRRPDPADSDAVAASKTAKSRTTEYFRQMKSYAKLYGLAYLGTNVAGIIDFGISQMFQAVRTTAPVTSQDAYSQLLQLETNTSKYMAANYEHYENSNGDLLEIMPGSSPFYAYTNSPYYFRRVPYDLYQALLHSNNPNIAHTHTFTDANGKKTTLHGVFVEQMYKGSLITVEIRPPWIHEMTRDAGFAIWPGSGLTTGKGIPFLPEFNWKAQFGIGPIEGMRAHLDLQVLFNDRYSIPTATTLRVGLPSLTQPAGVGIRQQNSSYWSRLNISFNAFDINAAKVVNLTDPQSIQFNAGVPGFFETSGIELTAMNNRFYLSLGNRDRVRLDYEGQDFTNLPGGQPTLSLANAYARIRETPFVELGVGADFAEVSFSNGSSIDLNGYYELQFYPSDFRMQLNYADGDLNTNPTWTLLPLLQIDPALQLTVNGDVPWADLGDIPRFIPAIPQVTAPQS